MKAMGSWPQRGTESQKIQQESSSNIADSCTDHNWKRYLGVIGRHKIVHVTIQRLLTPVQLILIAADLRVSCKLGSINFGALPHILPGRPRNIAHLFNTIVMKSPDNSSLGFRACSHLPLFCHEGTNVSYTGSHFDK